jgi:hypothetical protein
MPERLTLPATLLLVGVALGLAFGVQVLVGARASTASPSAKRAPALVQSRLGSAAAVGLSAAWAVPELRAPRPSAARTARSARITKSSVSPSVSLVSVPVTQTAPKRPTPHVTPAPRNVVRAPNPIRAPNPTPQPTPVATPEPSHSFDSGTGDFDSTGEATGNPNPSPTQTADGATR